MREYEKIETPTAFPGMCFCGSQKAPLVDTGILKEAYGHIYICMRCVTRSARALGVIKGAEHERLENAADELIQAEREVGKRQTQIDEQALLIVQQQDRLRVQADYINQLQGDLELRRKLIGEIAEMAAA